jgi:hypothetical protein
MLYQEYKNSPLLHILSFEDFRNFRGFRTLESLENEFFKKK